MSISEANIWHREKQAAIWQLKTNIRNGVGAGVMAMSKSCGAEMAASWRYQRQLMLALNNGSEKPSAS